MRTVLVCLLVIVGFVLGEDGSRAWLRYAPLPSTGDSSTHPSFRQVPSSIVALGGSEGTPVYTACHELQVGIKSILGKQLSLSFNNTRQTSQSITVGTLDANPNANGILDASKIEGDGFYLSIKEKSVLILGKNERGALYGAFEYLSRIAQDNFIQDTFYSNPHMPIRWINEWDNLDGTIERGYAGPSIFFDGGHVVENTTRVAEYARLLASVRINGIFVNNVNTNPALLSARNIEGLGRLADAMRPYGVQLGISMNFASPQTFGGLDTFDPLDAKVVSWWGNITEQIYNKIPDLAGYLIKANSEGQPGPLTYNRTLADGANLFARAVAPYNGVVMFRAFVYDNHINPSDWKADRANAAVDFFKPLDGEFDNNVVVQIKYGPIDFQVREPVSPLFANLRETNTAIELQITQEYLGQQAHLVYLAPLWKEILDFDLLVDDSPSVVRDIISGSRFNRKFGGAAAVVNVGTDKNWLGHHLAMSVSPSQGSTILCTY